MDSEFKEDVNSTHCNPQENFPSILSLILKGELDMAIKIIHQMQKCTSDKRKISETSHTLPDASSTEG